MHTRTKKALIFWAIVILLMFLIPIGVEYCIDPQASPLQKSTPIDLDMSLFVASDGVIIEDGIITIYDEMNIRTDQYQGYIHKLTLYGNSDTRCHYSVTVLDKNGKTIKVATSNFGAFLPQDTITINSEAAIISIRGNEHSIIEIAGASLVAQSAWALNRMLFVALGILCVSLLIYFRKHIGKHIETGFLIVAVIIGGYMAIFIPANIGVVYDDQIHFTDTYEMSYGSVAKVPPAAQLLTDLAWDVHALDTQEDVQTYYETIDTQYLAEEGLETEVSFAYKRVGYLPHCIMLWIGRSLNLPFHIQFIMGRVGGLAFYITLCYFAIKMAARYKVALTAIALVPVSILLAASYSYDPWITALYIFGISLLVSELVTPDKHLTWQRGFMIVMALALGCLPKAIYAPVMLLLLLLPSSKFASKKQKIVFKAMVTVVTMLLLATFVLPTILNPTVAGDPRGGDTSLKGQLEFILADIPRFIMVMLRSMWQTFPVMALNYVRTGWSYLGNMNSSISLLSLMLFLFAIYTDNDSDNHTLVPTYKQKLWMALCAAVVIFLPYLAMYLDFTPVGRLSVQGVQARYFIPAFPLLAVILQPKGIKNSMNKANYHLVLLLGNFFIIGITCYTLIVSRFLL